MNTWFLGPYCVLIAMVWCGMVWYGPVWPCTRVVLRPFRRSSCIVTRAHPLPHQPGLLHVPDAVNLQGFFPTLLSLLYSDGGTEHTVVISTKIWCVNIRERMVLGSILGSDCYGPVQYRAPNKKQESWSRLDFLSENGSVLH